MTSVATLNNFVSVLERLCNRYESDISAMRSARYDEATLRVEYLDPLFEALGWNIRNDPPQPIYLRDVIVENKGEDERGRAARVDYLFRTAGMERWACEAKRPFENIDRHFYQLQNYVFNLRLWVGVLSDFEHLILFVVGGRPLKDKPFSPPPGWRLHYTNYVNNAERIWNLLSREAVQNGSLETFIQSLDKASFKKSRQGWLIKPDRNKQVDAEFLSLLETQRKLFAKDIVKSNRSEAWTSDKVADCVQSILGRLLFQRVGEDRGIDMGLTLWASLEKWRSKGRLKGALWPTLVANFQHLSATFNGGVFGQNPRNPHMTDLLSVSDSLLEDFIEDLAGDASQYLFSSLPLSVIGSVYERFLSSVPDQHGEITIKPEARKAGGVFYTPESVVKQSVDICLSPLLRKCNRDELLKIKIIDPSCGSGSFLIVAFKRLLDYSLELFLTNPDEARRGDVFKVGESIQLTTAFKRKVLQNCIFGVDIDPVAVQVARMSLCLAVLENETQQALSGELRLFPKEKFLPDLDGNVVCANALIPVEAYKELGAEYVSAHRAIDWSDLKSQTNRGRGFDAVIGNPPWGAQLDERESKWLKRMHADVLVRMPDTYIYFADLVLNKLLRKHGRYALVLPGTLLNQTDAGALRRLLLENGIDAVADLGQGWFGGAKNTACIVVGTAGGSSGDRVLLNDLRDTPEQFRDVHLAKWKSEVRHEWEAAIRGLPDNIMPVSNAKEALRILSIGQNLCTLESLLNENGIQRGVTPDILEAHILTIEQARDLRIEREVLRNSIRGEDIYGFAKLSGTLKFIYTDGKNNIRKFPNAQEWLRKFRTRITCKEVKEGKHDWWRLHRPRNVEIFEGPKLVGLTTSRKIEVAIDVDGDLVVTDAMYVLKPKSGVPIEYIMAVMNSSAFLERYRHANSGGDARVIPQVKASKLSTIPVPKWRNGGRSHNEIVRLTNELCSIDGRDTKHAKVIDAVKADLNRLVLSLYGD